MSVSGEVVTEQHFVIHDVGWEDYEALSDRFSPRGVRLAFDRGTLELMTPSFNHEFYSRLICRFVQILTMELRIPIVSGGSTTFRREDLQRGLEPDECYYLAHADDVRGKTEIDLQLDPPPDLAVEIDITSSSLDRQGIYAALQVPEIWRFDTRELRVYLLDETGIYTISETSRAFPFLPIIRFEEFLKSGGKSMKPNKR